MRCTSLLTLVLFGPTLLAADYLKDVKPVLAARCYACHGALQQKAGLRLDTVAAMKDAEVLSPGRGRDSKLIKHVLGDAEHSKMPPAAEGERLTPQQVKFVQDWIDGGAIAPAQELPDPDPREHWAFRAPKRPAVPANGSAHPIDAFLVAKRQALPQPPAKRAEPLVLLRRLTLDLTGLPPSPELQARFLKDSSPEHYAKIVDELLQSPQYGERWGRHFLDIWRYSDWWGLGAELRNSQRHIWHWRDYVLENFNADTPYFEMLQDMLAADELHPLRPEKLRATGYLARPYFLFNRTSWLDETIEHLGKGMLGLTLNCAKCHDHKYDPIGMQDYYKMRAIFEPYQVRTDLVTGTTDPMQGGIPRAFDCNLDAMTYKHERGDDRRPITDRPIAPGLPALLQFEPFRADPVKLPAEAYRPYLKKEVLAAYLSEAQQRLDAARVAFEKLEQSTESPELRNARRQAAYWSITTASLEVASLESRFAAETVRTEKPVEFARLALIASKQEKRILLAKAEAEQAKLNVDLLTAKADQKPVLEKKRPGLLQAIETAKRASESVDVAYTIPRGAVKSAESNVESAASRDKPFPATSSGRRTALARWIADARNPLTARVLVNHVWLRHFGQSLVPTIFDFGRKGTRPDHPELLDWLAVEFTENRTSLKHLHKLIVTSQAYQMSSSMKGLNDNRTADPENKLYWRQNSTRMEAQVVRDSLLSLGGVLDLAAGGPPVPIAQQASSRRRSLYFFHSHNEHNKFLGQFDDANVLDCYRRTESIVPQQALALSNSQLALTMAEAITARLQKLTPSDTDEGFIRQAFQLLLGHQPSSEELSTCQEALKQWQALSPKGSAEAARAKSRFNLVAALLNHNDFVTVR